MNKYLFIAYITVCSFLVASENKGLNFTLAELCSLVKADPIARKLPVILRNSQDVVLESYPDYQAFKDLFYFSSPQDRLRKAVENIPASAQKDAQREYDEKTAHLLHGDADIALEIGLKYRALYPKKSTN